MSSDNSQLFQSIATTINASVAQVQVAVEMLDGGDTVPFISRYRKEATGGLTDTQLRELEQKLIYLREFNVRRESILSAIQEQGALTKELRSAIMNADTKSALEDLYLPFKKKRRTKGQIAIESGLESLADALWNSPTREPTTEAKSYISTELNVADEKAALDGARSILVERFAEDATLIGRLREQLQTQAFLCSGPAAKSANQKNEDLEKFNDYLDHNEAYSKIPGHRALAMFRGRTEGALSLKLQLKEADGFGDTGFIDTVASHLGFTDTCLLYTSPSPRD